MRLGWNWWQLGIGWLMVAAPAWGETLLVSPSQLPQFWGGEEKERVVNTRSEALGVDTAGLTSSPTPINPLPVGEGVRGEKRRNSFFPIRKGEFSSPDPNQLEFVEAGVSSLRNTQNTLLSQTEATPQPQETPKPTAEELELSPEIIENSPVLQRWLHRVPNVLDDIRHDPSFRTRLRVGYSQFPSTDQAAGFNVGVEDVFIGRTGLTVSGDYQASFNGEREAVGADLRYYVLPLGSYVNVAPQVGYRYVETGDFSTDGVNVGVRLMLALSRTGAADISLTQSFVSPGSNQEVGITTLSLGYAVTRNLRLSTDIQKQNSIEEKDSRVGIVLEWMP